MRQRFEFHEELWLPWQPKEKNLENLLVPNRMGQSSHLWHVASSSDPLPKYFKLWPGEEIGSIFWVLRLHTEMKKEILKNLLF